MGLSEPEKAAREAFLEELDQATEQTVAIWLEELGIESDETSSEKAAYWRDGGNVESSETGNTIFQWTYRDQIYPMRLGVTKPGAVVDLSHVGLTERDVEAMFDPIPKDYRGQVVVEHDRFNGICIKGEYEHRLSNEGSIAFYARMLDVPGGAALIELFAYDAFQDDLEDFGTKMMRHFSDIVAEAGITWLCLRAGLDFGKYSFAQMEFDYADPDDHLIRVNRLQWWAGKRGITLMPSDLSMLVTPSDFARFDNGAEVGRIDNPEVLEDDTFPIGKAFMLDAAGHGPWDAMYNAQQPLLEPFKGVNGKIYPKARFVRYNVPWLDPAKHVVVVGHERILPKGMSDFWFWDDWLQDDLV